GGGGGGSWGGGVAIIVAGMGFWPPAGLVAFRRCFGAENAERAVVVVRRPVESVLLAGAGQDALGVDARAVAAVLFGIFVFGVDEGEDGLDGIELVASDAAEENFLPAAIAVE